MKMIIGGMAQGKIDYAQSNVDFDEEDWIDGRNCGLEEIYTCKGIHHFHEYIRRIMVLGKDAEDLAENLIKNCPELVIVTDEVGYGVVPVDRFERQYRECVGRICTRLAAKSDQVIRVVCGIGQMIKGGTR